MPKSFTHAGQKYVIVGFYREDGKTRPITKTVSRPKPRIVSTTSLAEQRAGPPRKKFRIDPIVERKYYEYLRYQRQQGFKKRLPIVGLQYYYKTRKAAFIIEGGDPDYFDDQFDKVDTAVAADSWQSLNPELAKLNILTTKPSAKEERSEIRQEIRAREEGTREYEQYVRDQEERKN